MPPLPLDLEISKFWIFLNVKRPCEYLPTTTESAT